MSQTKQIISKAESNGWQQQVEMNQKLAQNLQNIISALEEPV
jgi:hypothetical protein